MRCIEDGRGELFGRCDKVVSGKEKKKEATTRELMSHPDENPCSVQNDYLNHQTDFLQGRSYPEAVVA